MGPTAQDVFFFEAQHAKAPGRSLQVFAAPTTDWNSNWNSILVYMDAPADDDEECPITLNCISETEVEEAEGEKVPFDEFPELSVAMLRCGHRFNAFTYFYHAMYSGMQCPVCRDGCKDRMHHLAFNRPWSMRFHASIATKLKQNALENMAAAERATEDAIHSENGMFPFTTELLVGRNSPAAFGDGNIFGLDSQPTFQLLLQAAAAVEASGRDAPPSQQRRLLQEIVVEDPGSVADLSADGVTRPHDVPLIFQLQTPVVVVDMFASIYLYGPNMISFPYASMDVSMRRRDYDFTEHVVMFSVSPHETRGLSLHLENSTATRFRVIVGYMRLLGGLERVAVSPEVNIDRQGQRPLLELDSVVGSGKFVFEFPVSIDGSRVGNGISGIRFLTA
jgi:hypothetical protein